MMLLFVMLVALLGLLAASVLVALVYGLYTGKEWGVWQFVRNTVIAFIGLLLATRFVVLFTTPMQVDPCDVYGEYVIDRRMFPGKNAEWQYATYRLEITEDDVLKLYQFNDNVLEKSHEVPVILLRHYRNTRLKLKPENVPRHHLLREQPIMVRRPWSFYYVFHSPHYGNMYFRKKGWWPYWKIV